MTISISASPRRSYSDSSTLVRPTFVGTGHPLEIVCKSRLSSNEVRKDANLRGRQTHGSMVFTFHCPAQTTCMAHTHVVYLFNAPCFPSVGTYLKHLKYSQLEIYSKPGPLIFSTIWHWWWLFFGVELVTEENKLQWEAGSITGRGLLHTYGHGASGLDQIRNHFPHPHRKCRVCTSWE